MESIIYSTKPDMDKLPGGWDPGKEEIKFMQPKGFCVSKPLDDYEAYVVGGLFNYADCDKLISFFGNAGVSEGVSVQGLKDVPDDRIGSVRTTAFCATLAEKLWSKMAPFYKTRYMDDYTPTDWWQHGKKKVWKPVAVSPMLRFMKYSAGGQHYAHYDAGYIYPDTDYRSLMSFVLYLTTNDTGATRIIQDNQSKIPVWDRKHDDWSVQAKSSEVLFESRPFKGNLFTFDHRICHDVDVFEGPERIIIRGDIIFKAV